MREIRDIIKDIRETEKLAITKLDDVNYKYRGGMGVAIRNACERLPKLLEEFKNSTIPHRLIAVFATGDESAISKVAEILTSSGGMVLDANAMYKKIADAVEPSYYRGREFGTTQFGRLSDVLRDIMAMVELNEMPAPTFSSQICPDTRATVNHIRKLVRGCAQDTLSMAYLKKTLSEELISKALEAKVIPILVTDVSSPEEKALINILFSRSTTVDFDKDFQVSKNSVVKLFKPSQSGDNATNED